MSASIKDRIVLITGASSGIGEAIAATLTKDGAKVVLMARRIEKLETMKNKIQSEGGSCLAVQADVTDRQQVEAAVKKIESEWGTVDILVNNAGVLNPGPIKNLQLDQWLQIVDVNIKGVLHCIGATLGPMVEKGRGHVINISSVGGKKAMTHLMPNATYYGSKFFIQGFTSGMRQELAPKGVKVCTICPGGVMTELFQNIKDPEAGEALNQFMSGAGGAEKILENEMMLMPEDVAETVSYVLKQPSRVGLNDVVIEPRGVSLL